MKSADDIGAKVDSSVNELKIIHDLIEIHADFAVTTGFALHMRAQGIVNLLLEIVDWTDAVVVRNNSPLSV